jgi:hypothetical protein
VLHNSRCEGNGKALLTSQLGANDSTFRGKVN